MSVCGKREALRGNVYTCIRVNQITKGITEYRSNYPIWVSTMTDLPTLTEKPLAVRQTVVATVQIGDP